MAAIRIQKYLSEAGVCSRRRGERLIREGRVAVNGRVVTELGSRIDPEADRIEVDGRPVQPRSRLVYIALNKPEGVVTSCAQPGVPVVVDLVDVPERLFPVGRLDKDSTGLVILTNDGRIHHRLLHPSFDHEKEYEVTVSDRISDSALHRIARGMPILGSRTRPATVRRLSGDRFRIVLKEGRNRQIRRMVRKVGGQVNALVRIRIANVRLGKLPLGRWRHLSAREVDTLLRQTLEVGGNGEE
ncbi:MAG: pseudouridine synthase [Desulfobacterales bacterium]